ncbi:SWI/SNF-related matrix-associated actin-dependent regulator of chromatin subfamily B [Mucor ambiguus]|uniref:SWI/SNF-related matrix-associated actin-dependent regulator of chromatin subfamily B n=1 Tax=Mucor ambiguus TaxID=91626 RepID=A0A0C9M9Q5_9FUNG|nr:SWI/SNF-related matrix-associated actin-dependent regulator of chromatin subfamily B [Mucor ambiguus]
MSGYPYPIDLNRQPIQIQPMPQQQIMPRPIVPHMAAAAAAPHPQQQQQPLAAMPQQHLMYAAGPSSNIQGYFSSYSARIKQSQENALLLPISYVTGKKHRLGGGDSDDDFEDMLEDSDNDDDSDNNEENTRQTRANTAVVEADAKALAAMQEQQKKLPKIPHKKNMLYPQTTDLLHTSEVPEMLVPVRLDIDMDEVKLRDVFLWNMNEQYLTPEMFAELLCEDLQLEYHKFIKPIAESIRAQILDFESIQESELPNGGNNQIVEINLDLQIGKVNLRDKFEWDLNNIKTNAPEIFSKQLASELGLGGEYVNIISHGIRDQLFRHRKRLVEEFEGLDRRHPPSENALENGYRKITDAVKWAPKLEVLSNDELEKLLIAQERNIRRLRRETRFKRNSRRSRN